MTDANLHADLRSFLSEIAGDDPIEELVRQEAVWAGGQDLNEEWIASLRVRAARLLERMPDDAIRGLLQEHAEAIREARWNMANSNADNVCAALVAFVDAVQT